MLRRLVDALIFGNVWVALAATAVCAASGSAQGAPATPGLLGLVFSGTLAVYSLDRLRDLPRDRVTSPERSAFVTGHRRALIAATGLAAAAAIALGFGAGPRVAMLAGIVLGFGLLHRRLKRFALAKPLYLTASWTAVCVGLPWAASAQASHTPGVATLVGLSVAANVVLSNLRDGEGGAGVQGQRRALALAGLLLAPAAGLALFGPRELLPLVWLPALMAAAIAGFRPTERYGLFVVDGALLAGAMLALLADA